MATHPSSEQSRVLLEHHGVPIHICRHSEKVAHLARRLSEALNVHAGESVDVDLVEAASLLHDIAKAICIVSHKDHAMEGGRILRDLGFADMAGLVERHVELGPWDPAGPVMAAEILNYADKRVRHEEVVSLVDRFDDLNERYGRGSDKARGRIEENRKIMEALEIKIFRGLPFGPEELQEWGKDVLS